LTRQMKRRTDASSGSQWQHCCSSRHLFFRTSGATCFHCNLQYSIPRPRHTRHYDLTVRAAYYTVAQSDSP
jgi:hypothetical protein